MNSASKDAPLERQGPNIRNHIDGVKFRQLAPGITTHPLVRSGRPCIEGTGLKVTNIVAMKNYHAMVPAEIADHFAIELRMVEDALNYYAAHSDYIDTEIKLNIMNHDQMVEAQDDSIRTKLLSRRESVP